ncbi:hypothetical protein Bbelb_377400 [Branchiostoma belcheri]|nr:hypothetical protein Bbelb_377400 [Branchiostoma belcheri]
MNGYYKHCPTIRSPCMSYGTVPKSRGENRVPADEQFCRWHTLTAISPPKVFSLPQLQGQPHLASSMLLTSPKERAERNTLAPFKGPYRIQHGVFRIARGIGPTAGRVARRPQADPTRRRAGTEGDAEYTNTMGRMLKQLLIFLLIILNHARGWMFSAPDCSSTRCKSATSRGWMYSKPIDNNPWRCDCDIMVPFWLKKNGLRLFENQIVCSQPAKFSGQKLKNIRPGDLLCKVPTPSPVNDQTESANNANNDVTCTHRTTSYHSISKQNTGTTARPIDTTFTTLPFNPGKLEGSSSQNSLLESAGNAYNSIVSHTPRYHSNGKQNIGTTARQIDTTSTTLPVSQGQGQSRAITESNANTKATLTVVTDVHHHQDEDINQHYQTGQGQSQTTTDHDELLSIGRNLIYGTEPNDTEPNYVYERSDRAEQTSNCL